MNVCDELFALPHNVQTRWASMENPDAAPGAAGRAGRGRKGAPCKHNLAAGETLTLAHAAGRGTVRRLWMTISDRSPLMLRGLVLRGYWDGAQKPAIEAPLGDFFCLPLGRMVAYENAWFDSAEGRSFNCRLPMPFKNGFRLTVTNESPEALRLFFYDVNFTIGDDNTNAGYLHAHWRREKPTQLERDFEILPRIAGRGRFLGCNIGAIADQKRYGRLWWGEGEVKIYLDGDEAFPTLCGTGTEDYIGTGWGQGAYACQWHGSPLADAQNMQFGFYRLHGPDPVYFYENIRVAIQQIGHGFSTQIADMMDATSLEELPVIDGEGRLLRAADFRGEEPRGHLFERQDDWCATAYFYLDSRINELPPLADYDARIEGLLSDTNSAARFD